MRRSDVFHPRAAPAALLTMATALLSACSALPSAGDRASDSAPPRAGAPQRSATAAQCLSDLGMTGASFSILPDRYAEGGCSTLDTVQMTALTTDDRQLRLGNIGPVTCPVSHAFAGWARFGADRAARQILGSAIARIETFGSYSCRNVAGSGRRSAHATAAAIDIAGFVLTDGRRITVKSDWDEGTAEERQFLRVVQQSACKRFDTVLGPEYNAAHEDHFHLEGVAGSGRGFCR